MLSKRGGTTRSSPEIATPSSVSSRTFRLDENTLQTGFDDPFLCAIVAGGEAPVIPSEDQTFMPERWRSFLEETVHFYLELCYLPYYTNVPLETAARDLYFRIGNLESFGIQEEYGAKFQRVVPGSRAAEERVLLGGNIGCVLNSSPEAIECVYYGYERLLDSLSLCSRGIFSPEKIREDWNLPDSGNPVVTFQIDGAMHSFHAEYFGGYDIRLFSLIDQLMVRKGYSLFFHVNELSPQADLLFLLNAEEHKRIEAERGLSLQRLDEWSGHAD